jgi:CheY-like chemotaxis protein
VAHPSTPASLSVSVLIVDDSADTREMYECAFAYAGFRVLQADNGADGLSRAAEALPDVIVTDLSIPRMDGFELLARIQTHPRTERIAGDRPVRLGGRRCIGACDRRGRSSILLKPCSPESLIHEVRRALSASCA